MAYTQLQSGTIEVGDKLKGTFSHQMFVVHRVTVKFAFVKYNETTEGKFDRKFVGSTKRRPFHRFDDYDVYRKYQSEDQ